MDDLFIRWGTGLAVALLGGLVVVEIMLRFMPPKFEKVPGGVPSMLTGLIERAFFAPVVGAGVFGLVIPAMLGWLTLKMAANWGRTPPASENSPDHTSRAQRSIKALLCGLVSMGFAALGGLICAGEISLCFSK